MTAGAAIVLRSRPGWAADMTDSRVADIVAKTIGIDTHNHIDVSLTAAEITGPDIDLSGEIMRSGLAAICLTFATDYQPGDAYDRFLKGLASMDRQLECNGMNRSLTADDIRTIMRVHPKTLQRYARRELSEVFNSGRCGASERATSIAGYPNDSRVDLFLDLCPV
jgi:membrane dipeptidase